MKRFNLEQWIRQIYQTREEESSCSDYYDLIAQYVDREMAGEDVAETMPHLKQLLDRCRDQCRACFEEYEVLRELARLEAGSGTPAAGDRPASP